MHSELTNNTDNSMEIKGNILSQKDYERLCKTPQEVCRMVSTDLKLKGISRSEAASRLGVQAPVVTIQLSGKKYFGSKAADKYSMQFGYNPIFLKTGIGYLNTDASLDSNIYVSRAHESRVKAVTTSYIRYKDLHTQLECLQKDLDQTIKELNKALKALEVEKQRNDKLNVRIEKLMDFIDTSK